MKCSSDSYSSNEIRKDRKPISQSQSGSVAQTIFVFPVTVYIAEVYDKHGHLFRNISLNPPLPFSALPPATIAASAIGNKTIKL